MGLPKQCLLVLTALCTVTLATQDVQHKELLPLIASVIRRITFQGQSQRHRPPFPIPTKGQCDCQFHVTCASQLDEITQTCQRSGGGKGVCCPPVWVGSGGLRNSYQTRTRSVFKQEISPRGTLNVSMTFVNSACNKGINDVENFYKYERKLLSDKTYLQRGTPASNHLRVFKTGPETRELQKKAQQLAAASQRMADDLKSYISDPGSVLHLIDAGNSKLGKNCRKRPYYCNPESKYRTADGSCNNVDNPEWGMSQTELRRLLPPKYEDGIESARVNSVVKGLQLPSVRTLSTTILTDVDKPDQRYTLSVMQWAQFMDHDVTHSPFPDMQEYDDADRVTGREEGIQCCTNTSKMITEGYLHRNCMPIEIPTNDTFFARREVTCMNFIRSNIVPPSASECRFGHVEQINILTQWIDGSTVYGQNQYEQNELRNNSNGLLRNSSNNFLPEDAEAAECDATNRVTGGVTGKCYLAGESRVNEQPGITMMHTLWMRQHNRIAGQLHQLNPFWSDDAVFQETRRIIAAQITHITYNEWLPIIIGNNFMEEYGLLPQRNGFTSDYDPNINANIHNEFTTAAFRFGHSLVQGLINLFSVKGSVNNTRLLRDNFMTGHLIAEPGVFDEYLRGLTRQPSQKMDNHITEDLTNHLLQVPKYDFGMDLMSINIQRGRDHAIGTYNEARKLCNLGLAKTFNDLTDTIPPRIVKQLRKLYAHVDDIDLFVGGMAETSMDGALLGPTFLCIVGDQFARLKIADRYYYELQGQAGQFNLDQLQQIRLTSWARIVCDNSENPHEMEIRPLAFRFNENSLNPLVPCTSPIIPQINLQPWKQQQDESIPFPKKSFTEKIHSSGTMFNFWKGLAKLNVQTAKKVFEKLDV